MTTISVQISEQDLLKQINERYRSFFDISPVKLDQTNFQLFKNFIDAVNLVCKYADINKRVDIHFITRDNPTLDANGTHITFKFRPDAIHMTYNNSIFINLHRASDLPNELQVAAYLEEFLHFFMNIKNEHLVKKVLSLIYPVVKYDPTTMGAYSDEP